MAVVALVMGLGLTLVLAALFLRWRRAWRLAGVVHARQVEADLEACRRRTRANDKRRARATRRLGREGVSNL